MVAVAVTSDLSAAAAAAVIAAAAAESAVTILVSRSLLSGSVGIGLPVVSGPLGTPMGLGGMPVGVSMDTLGWAELEATWLDDECSRSVPRVSLRRIADDPCRAEEAAAAAFC